MSDNGDIPEFIRAGESGGRPIVGIVVMAVLGLLGIGLVVFAAIAFRTERESAAIAATVAAFNTPLPTPIVVEQLPAATDTATAAPVENVPTEPPSTETEPPAAEEPAEAESEDTPTPAKTATPGSEARPTRTQTPGAVPPSATPTDTPPADTPAPAIGGSHGVTGSLTMCDPNKPSYATNIERICFVELITNTTDADISYGVLGVRYTNQETRDSSFHTSWDSSVIPANGQGPDNGPWEDGLFIATPGTYTLTLEICFSDKNTCQGAGDWETLTPGITVSVIDWTPSP